MSKKKDPLKVRSSANPLFFECASSQEECEQPYDPHLEVGDLGSAIHQAAEVVVKREEVSFPEIAARWDLEDIQEFERMVGYFRKLWSMLSKLFPAGDLETEVEVEGPTGKGHMDIRIRCRHQTFIIDLKTGRLQKNYTRQMQSYANAERYDAGGVPEKGITTIIVWVRYFEYEARTWFTEQLDAYEQAFYAQARLVGKRWTPGEDCGFCQHFLTCRARQEWTRAAGSAMVELKNMKPIPREALAEIYFSGQYQAIKRAFDHFDACLKAELRSGPLHSGDGDSLVLRKQVKQIIDPVAAWPVLRDTWGFSDEDIAETLTVSKGKVENLAANKAAHGGKGKAKLAIMENLKDVGAITEVFFSKRQKVKTENLTQDDRKEQL